ncbi:MAG: glycosyltransferase family 9 protein [Roseiarcus sp.]|jgi:lipopolysaccharide heptosyltransferase I
MHGTTLADRSFQRILLIKLSAIGDVIHTIPLLNALRRHYPAARIDWLSKPTPAEFIRDLPAVDEVLVYGENQTEVPQYNWDGFTHFVRLIRDHKFLAMLSRLRAARYDLVIDMQGQMRSGFVSMVTGAPVRIGFDRPRKEVWEPEGRTLPPGAIERSWKGAREGSWLAYTHRVRLPTLAIHAIDRYLLVGDLLGFEREPPDFSIPIRAEADRRVDALLREHAGAMTKPPIVMMPGSLWETKRWRPEGFAAVARHFLAQGYPVLIDGAANQAEECRRIAAAAPGAVVLAGLTSLAELAALIRRSAIAVTNDSGPLHLTTALGRPVVALFGPTNPVWFGPYQRPDAIVSAGVACSPCNLRDLARCPHDHACMRGITPERVIGAIEAQLALAEPSARSLD